MKGCMSSRAHCWGSKAQKTSTIYSRWSHGLAGTGTGGSHREKILVEKKRLRLALVFLNSPHFFVAFLWVTRGDMVLKGRETRYFPRRGAWWGCVPPCPAPPGPPWVLPPCKRGRASAESWLLWFGGGCEVISKSFFHALPRFGGWFGVFFHSFLLQSLARFLPAPAFAVWLCPRLIRVDNVWQWVITMWDRNTKMDGFDINQLQKWSFFPLIWLCSR